MKTKIFAIDCQSQEELEALITVSEFCSEEKVRSNDIGDCFVYEVTKDNDDNLTTSFNVYYKSELLTKDVVWVDKSNIRNIRRYFEPLVISEKPIIRAIFSCDDKSEKKWHIERYKKNFFKFSVSDNFFDPDLNFIEVDIFEGTIKAFTKRQVVEKYPQYSKKIKLPAGKYYIGDLCYVYNNNHPRERELWDQVCNDMDFDDRYCVVDTTVDGVRMVYASTAYGDGSYEDNKGNSYCVDAGIIGIMSADICNKDYFESPKSAWGDLGHFHEFKEDFEVVIELCSFKFGDIFIDTN